ncbi:HNH endonuclease domain containing protein [Zalerion maritima]|uniref:HNH endonuclease domain containing protein n=1 Tax=Zalerion maritima TaxID=339359 RepID=A0AAD5WV35_9PEZI|nr:HNH endonuclease domain containing protein [Zalerion maritima]
MFPGFDPGGIYHETARVACSIIADCQDGYLSTDWEGSRLVEGPDELLDRQQYYFVVENVPVELADLESHRYLKAFDSTHYNETRRAESPILAPLIAEEATAEIQTHQHLEKLVKKRDSLKEELSGAGAVGKATAGDATANNDCNADDNATIIVLLLETAKRDLRLHRVLLE